MKALKIVGIVFGIIVVLVAVLFAVALTPSVQTWAVRKALAGQPGMQLEVGRVAAGFSAADLTDVRLVQDGTVITVKSVSARYDAWDYLSNQRINADSVIVRDAVVDLRNAKPASDAGQPGAPGTPKTAPAEKKSASTAGKTPSEPKKPFEGLLEAAKLPFSVRVANLAANGRALLSENQTAVFDVKGAGIETGAKGKLEWTVDFADATANAPLRGLRSTGTAQVQIARDNRIDLVEVDTIAAAMGPKLPPDRVQITARLDKPQPAGNEGYNATVALLRGTRVEPLLKANAQYLAASKEIAGAWDLAVRSEQLAAVLAGLGLPEVAANGAGKFNLKPDTTTVSATGDLTARASKLETISPALAAIGAVNLKLAFDGGLAGETAQLNRLGLEATSADGRKFADVTTAQKVGYQLDTKRITFADAKAELARISIQALPLAWAQPALQGMAIDSGELSLALAVEAEPDGSRVRARALEPLALRNVTVRQGDKKLADRVTLTARPAVDYSSTRVLGELNDLNIAMPTGDSVTGKLSADVTNLATKPAIAFASQINAKIVEALKPYLPVPLNTGPLHVTSVTEGKLDGDVLQLAKASTTVTREGGALLLSVETQQPITGNLTKTTFTAANPQAAAARLRLGEIPLAWAEPFVANSKLSGNVSGAVLEVALRSLDDLTVVTTEPLALRGVTASLDGKPTVNGIDLTANLTATKRGETVTYEVRRVEVKQGQALLAGLSVAGEAKLGAKFTLAAKGNLEADVPALTTQPALAQFATLSRGAVTANFDANISDAINAKALLSARNLVARQDSRALGDLEVNLTAAMKPDGSGTISAPITLTNAARKSDIAIDGSFGKAADQKTFVLTGRIVSNNLIVDDFEPLAGLAPKAEATAATGSASRPSTTPAPAPRPTTTTPAPSPAPRSGPVVSTPAPAGRDTEPFWKGVNGKVELDLKRILYGKDYTISGVRGSAVITDSRLSLDGLEGRFKDNPFKIAGGLTFAATQPKPYSLTAAADVNNFDVGEFLRAAAPNELPALETKATVTARLNGTGGTLPDLAKNAFGKFELTGTQGVARYLARKGNAGTAVNVLTTGLAILGAARGSDTTVAVAEIARLLNEVRFDSVKMQVERGADLTFKLTSMEVLSPIVRMTGSGTVASKSTDDVASAPMNVVLQLGAKGELAHLFSRVGMLAGVQTQTGVQPKTDDKGYALMTRTFTIGGTASKPDSSSLWKILGEAAAGALLR
jgi:hypothetical protein